MDYTILSTEAVHSDQIADIGRSGNKWTVGFVIKEAQDNTRFTTVFFDSFEAAFERYGKLVEQMAQGNYSALSRRNFVLTGKWEV